MALRRSDLAEHLGVTCRMARWFGGLAAIPVALYAVINVFDLISDRPLLVPWSVYAALVAFIVVGYTVAATVAALLVLALRPLRRWLLGWLLAGFLVAAGIYGSLALLLVAACGLPSGQALTGIDQAEAWGIAGLTPLIGLGGVLAAPVFRWVEHRSRAV